MHLFDLGESAWALIIRSAGIYLVLLVGLRVFGKREVGQFTLFDLVFVLLVANAVQPAMTGRDTTLGGGFVIIGTLLTLNYVIARLRVRFPIIERLLESKSVVVARDGRWLRDKLEREGITDDECMAALREHGIGSIEETKLVVLEADGSLSVVPKDATVARRQRRRVRFVKRA